MLPSREPTGSIIVAGTIKFPHRDKNFPSVDMVEVKQASIGFSYGSLECRIFVFSSVIFISAVLFCDTSAAGCICWLARSVGELNLVLSF